MIPSRKRTIESQGPIRVALVAVVGLLASILFSSTPVSAAPNPVASCNANDNGTSWSITWTAATGSFDGYIIERSIDGGNTWYWRGRDNVPGSDLGFADTDNNATATYRVFTKIDNPESTSAPTTCTTGGNNSAPPPPASCTVSDNGTAWVVTWDSVANIDAYIIERSVNGNGPYWRGRVDNGNGLTFTDTDNNAGATYQVLTKLDPNNESQTATTCTTGGNNSAPPPPASCTVSDNGTAWVVTWDSVANIDAYIIERSVNGNGPYWRGRVDNGNGLTFTDTDNNAGATYQVLTKLDPNNESQTATTCTTGGGGAFDPVPASEQVDWENTGRSQSLGQYGSGATINVASAGGNDAQRINTAINQAAGNGGGTVQLDGGVYNLDQVITFGSNADGVVLRGSSNGNTVLRFSQAMSGSIGINFNGSTQIGSIGFDNPLRVSQGNENTRSLTISTNGLNASTVADTLRNQFVFLDARGGTGAPNPRMGQIVYVTTAVAQNGSVAITTRHDLEDDMALLRIRPLQMVEESGLRDVKIEYAVDGHQLGGQRASGSLQHGIQLKFTSDVFIHNVVSGTTNNGLAVQNRRGQWGAHVLVNASYRCSVTDSDFIDASLHGDGGEGYGVSFSNNGTRCRIENNTFERLRHSILIQQGATANVVAFNYARDPFHTNFTPGGPADMSFHGYQTANLIEGNVIERIHVDDTDFTGNRNVIFRNCLYSGPLTLQRSVQNSFVGNAMYGTNTYLRNRTMPNSIGLLQGNAIVSVPSEPYLAPGQNNVFDSDGIYFINNQNSGNLLYGNWYQGDRPGGQNQSLVASYYGASQGPMLSNPSSSVTQSCTNTATARAGDLAAAVNDR